MDKKALLIKKSILNKKLGLIGLPLDKKLKLKEAAKKAIALLRY